MFFAAPMTLADSHSCDGEGAPWVGCLQGFWHLVLKVSPVSGVRFLALPQGAEETDALFAFPVFRGWSAEDRQSPPGVPRLPVRILFPPGMMGDPVIKLPGLCDRVAHAAAVTLRKACVHVAGQNFLFRLFGIRLPKPLFWFPISETRFGMLPGKANCCVA